MFVAAAFLLTCAAHSSASEAVIAPRADDALRAAMNGRLKTAGAAAGTLPDADTLAVASRKSLLLAGAAVDPQGGLVGILEGETFALLSIEGDLGRIAKGTYRVALDDGDAVLLRSNGSAAARGTASLDLIANPGTPYCEFDDPHPGSDTECLRCSYGNPNGPVGVWSVSTCFQIQLFP
jgi:hypothetical protein